MASSPPTSPKETASAADGSGSSSSNRSMGTQPSLSNPSLQSSGSPREKLSKTPSVDAGSRRSRFARTGSGASPASRSQMDASFDGTRRRRSSYAGYRRASSFDLPHINSIPTVPVDLKKLETIDVSKVPWWTSQRFLLSVICFFGFAFLYAQRVNLSITIVTMVIHDPEVTGSAATGTLNISTVGSGGGGGVGGSSGYRLAITTAAAAASTEGQLLVEDRCPELSTNTTGEGEFHWNKPLQGLILGSFFWGYLLLQVMGGMVSERFGARRVIALGMMPVAILTILTPVCARADPYLFIVVRALIGLGEGVMYPAAQALWSHWAPPNERSRLIGFSYAGGQFGNAMIFPIGGFLCAYGFDGGWPSVYYIIGAGGLVWCIVWILFTTDYPSTNKWISDIERKYIQANVGDRMKKTKGLPTPWKAIFTSRGMWAIIVAHMCGNYGAYMLLTQIPSYMKEVLKFDIKSNGVFSMLPYLVFWFFITVSSMLADFLISREILSVAWTRKLMAGIGMVGPGCFLIGTGFMQCHQQIGAVVMLTVAVGLCGFHFSGYFINHGDIAPAFAGTLFGISNTAATVPGILAPYVVTALTTHGTQEEWQKAFYVAAAIYFFGAVFYALMGQGDVQPWADFDEPDGGGEEDEGKTQDVNIAVGLHDLQEVHEEEEEDEEEARAAEKMLNNVHGKASKTRVENQAQPV